MNPFEQYRRSNRRTVLLVALQAIVWLALCVAASLLLTAVT